MAEHTPPRQYRECADTLRGLPGVVAVDVLGSDARVDGPCLDAVVDADRVPPRVCRALAEFDLGVRDVTTRGDPTHSVVVAV